MDVRALAKVKPIEQNPEPPQPRSTGINANSLDALMALADKQLCQQYRDYGIAGFTQMPPTPAAAPAPAAEVASFCKPTGLFGDQSGQRRETPGQNAACPCGSGLKFKRCCGNRIAAAIRRAA